MGCGQSKSNPNAIRAVDYLLQMYPQTLAFLELSPYSHALAQLFSECDKNNNQSLSISEFLTFTKVARTRVAVRLFSIFDADGSGTLDFREIMVTIWHLCTLDHKGLEALVYDLYDDNQDGQMEVEDLVRLLEDCYGKESMATNDNIMRLLQTIAKGGAMGREKWFKFCSSSPQTMKQVIDLQKGVQQAVLGVHIWRRLVKRRKQRIDPTFRPENWQNLMERIIVLDLTARNKAGAPDKKNIIIEGGKKKRGGGDDGDEEDEALETEDGVHVGLSSAGMAKLALKEKKKHKKGKGKGKKKDKEGEGGAAGAGGTGAPGELARSPSKRRVKAPTDLDSPVQPPAPAEGEAGAEGQAAPPPPEPEPETVKNGYRLRNRDPDKKARERAIRLKQRERAKRNELGNTGKPGVYESEGEAEREAAEKEAAEAEARQKEKEERKKAKGKGKGKGKKKKDKEGEAGAAAGTAAAGAPANAAAQDGKAAE